MTDSVMSFLRDPIGRCVFIGLIVVAVGGTVYGAGLGGFGSNLAAEIVGNAVSILATLVIIDWFVDYRRKRTWADVHALTFRAIATHLGEIGSGVYRHFPDIPFSKTIEAFLRVHEAPINQETALAFPEMVRFMRQHPKPYDRNQSASDIVVAYYADLEWDFRQIQDILTPRLIQTPSNEVVVSSLILFDQAHRTLRHAIIGHQQARTQSAYKPLVALLEAAGNAYGMIHQQSLHRDAGPSSTGRTLGRMRISRP